VTTPPLYIPPTLRLEELRLGRDVPAYMLLPREQEAPRPALVLLHGYSHSKAAMYNQALRAAQLGFVAVGIDAWGHGERAQGPFTRQLPERANFLLRVLKETGEDLLGVLEALEARPEVRPEALGLVGVSMGGMITHYALTLTDRVRAAVTLIASAEWEWIEQTTTEPELREFASASAPLAHVERYPPAALLLLNGAQDDVIPVATARRTYERLRPAYQDDQARLQLKIYPDAGHRVTVEMTRDGVAWLQEWLA
jgi:dienelactone hydrolase